MPRTTIAKLNLSLDELAATPPSRLLEVAREHLGPIASIRLLRVLLAVATSGQVNRMGIQDAVGGTLSPLVDDLRRLGFADRHERPGLRFVRERLDRRDQRKVVYSLTAQGQRVAQKIIKSLEASKEDGAANERHGKPQVDETAQTLSIIALAPEAVTSAPPALALIPPSGPESPAPRNTVQKPPASERLPKFRYKGLPLRAVRIDGAAWFLAGDLCKVLGRSTSAGTAKALRFLKAEDKRLIFHTEVPAGFLGERCYQTNGVSLAGLHKLVKRTQGPVARAFEEWVQERILPCL